MKQKLRLVLCALVAGAFFNSSAQTGILPNRGCGTGMLPQQFENWLQSIPQPTNQNQTMSVFNIPVIVHVIHNNESLNSPSATSGGNLNAAQIIDQIDILNHDYNALNTDTASIPAVFKPAMGRFQFNFCMAVVNPTGGVLAEPGIDRVNAANMNNWTSPPYSQSYVDAVIKPATIWDPTKYMNMWVLDIGGSILGYATFPNPGSSGLSGLSPPYGSSTTDGLVMKNNAFGSIGTAASGAPYNLGRTATHEIGHWVGLRHVWGDNGQCGGTDYCNDTPPQEGGTSSPAGCNYGCPTFPLHANTCTLSGQSNVNGDMFMNYMDYTNDACMYMFTNDQKNRAQLIMTNSPMRASLLTSTVCSLPTATNDVGILFISNPTYSQVISCVNAITPILHIQNFGSNIVSTVNFSYNVDGATTQTVAWSGTLMPSSYIIVGLPQIGNLSNGSHTLYVGAYSPNGVTDSNPVNNTSNQIFSMTNIFAVAVSGNTVICPGQSASLTVSAAAISYTWMPGSSSGTTAIVTPTANTIYTVTADNGTCVNSETIMVVVGGVQVSASTNTLCSSGPVTLTASSANTYSWDNGSNSNTIVVNPSVTTTYSVVGDNGSCTGTAVVTITVGAVPVLTVTASPAAPICSGGSATLSVMGAGSYSWDSGSTSSMVVMSPTASTVYSVTGTDGGCSTTETVQVTVGSGSISLLITASPSTVCAGGTVTLTGSGAGTYTWNTGDITPVVVVSPTTTTEYTFDGTDGSCVGHASIIMSVTPAPPLSVSMNPSLGIVCLGNTATLTATGGYSNYAWSNLSTDSAIVVVATSTTPLTYTVNSIDALGGCSVSSVVTVYVRTGPVSVISNTNSNCLNPCTGAVTATTTGGTPPYTYHINNSSCTWLPCTNLCPGLYTIGTMDSIGCTSYNIFSISNFAVNFIASITATNASCNTCNDGAAHANVFSGTPPYTYQWTPFGGTQATATNLGWASYTVTVTDSVGCIVQASSWLYVVNGIATISGNEAFQMYPNPAKDKVTIVYEGAPFDYAVYNHLGQLIVSQKNNKNTAMINSDNFASGIYMVEINNGKERLRKKLIIE